MLLEKCLGVEFNKVFAYDDEETSAVTAAPMTKICNQIKETSQSFLKITTQQVVQKQLTPKHPSPPLHPQPQKKRLPVKLEVSTHKLCHISLLDSWCFEPSQPLRITPRADCHKKLTVCCSTSQGYLQLCMVIVTVKRQVESKVRQSVKLQKTG